MHLFIYLLFISKKIIKSKRKTFKFTNTSLIHSLSTNALIQNSSAFVFVFLYLFFIQKLKGLFLLLKTQPKKPKFLFYHLNQKINILFFIYLILFNINLFFIRSFIYLARKII